MSDIRKIYITLKDDKTLELSTNQLGIQYEKITPIFVVSTNKQFANLRCKIVARYNYTDIFESTDIPINENAEFEYVIPEILLSNHGNVSIQFNILDPQNGMLYSSKSFPFWVNTAVNDMLRISDEPEEPKLSHNDLSDKYLYNQHPIVSISGLTEELEDRSLITHTHNLENIIGSDNIYSKEEIDNLLNEKTDDSDVYTKTETDNLINIERNNRLLADKRLEDMIDNTTTIIENELIDVNNAINAEKIAREMADDDLQGQINQLKTPVVSKPAVDTFADLATTYPNAEAGWLVLVREDETDEGNSNFYLFDGEQWNIYQAGTIDLSDYYDKNEIDSKFLDSKIYVDGKIEEIDTQIGTINTDITSLESNINSVKNDITNLEDNILDIEDSIEQLENNQQNFMTKEIYDSNDNGIVDKAESLIDDGLTLTAIPNNLITEEKLDNELIEKIESGTAQNGIPEGGITGQVLAKASDSDYDTVWVEQSGGSGGGIPEPLGPSNYLRKNGEWVEGKTSQEIDVLIGDIDESIINIENNIETLENSVTGIETDVNSINISVSDLESDVSQINQKLITVDTSIDNINLAVDDIKSDVEINKTNINEINEEIESINIAIADNTSNITELNNGLDTVSNKVATLENLGHLIGVVTTKADLNALQTVTDIQNEFNQTPTVNDYVDVQVDEENGNISGSYGITAIDTDGNITWTDLPFRVYSTEARDFEINPIKTEEIEDGAVTAEKLADEYLEPPTGLNTIYGYYRNSAGVGMWANASPVSHTLHVEFTATQTQEDGSLAFPFKTLQAAVNASGFGDCIIIGPGESTENVIIANDNLTIVVEGTDGQYRTKINGNLTMASSAKRIGITGIEITGTVYVNCAEGLFYADHCDFGSVNYSGTFNGYSKLLHCYFENGLVMASASNGIVDTQFCQWENGSSTIISTGIVYVIGGRQFSLNHSGGRVFIYGDTQCVANSDGYAITSTANASTSNGLFMLGGTTFNGSNYVPINKSGTCQYSFGIFLHEPNIDILNGTRIDAGLHADDMYAHFNPVNYTKDSDTILNHLKGIDTALGSVDVELKNKEVYNVGDAGRLLNIWISNSAPTASDGIVGDIWIQR